MGYFTGQKFALPYGQDGLNGAENLDLVRANQLITADNISFARGGIAKDGGAAKFNAAALGGGGTVIGVYDWWPTAGTQRTIAFVSNGAAYRDTGAGTFATTLRSGATWSTSSIPVFVEAGAEAAGNNHKLFIFLGSLNQVQVLAGDGLTISDIAATIPADWVGSYPVCGANHLGRLWGAGNSTDPHRAYYSTTTNNEDFGGAGSGSIAIFPGEGDGIVSMASFKGLLVVWKRPRGIYAIDTTDPTATNWVVRRISSNVGGASPRCWCVVDNDILFMDANGGFHFLSAVQEYGDVGTSDIGRRVFCNEWERRNLNLSSFARTRAVYYPSRREAHFSVSSTGLSTWDRRMVWDFNGQNDQGQYVPRLRGNTFPNGPELYSYLDSNSIRRIGCGDNAGFIWRFDQADLTYDGAGYSSVSRSAAIDIDDETRQKNARFLEMSYVPKGSWNVAATLYWDDQEVHSINFSMAGGGTPLGTFTIGTHTLGGEGFQRQRWRTFGGGYRLSLQLENNNAGEDYAISNVRLLYDLGSDRFKGS